MKVTDKTFSLLFAIFAVFYSVGAPAASYGNSPSLPNECQFGLDADTLQKLELTETQRIKLANLQLLDKNAMTEELVKGSKVRQAYRMELQKLLLAKQLNEAAASKLMHQMADSQAYINLRLMEQQHAILDILSEKQKAAYKEIENKKASQCRS